jgi:hypothetical protein
VSPGRFEGAPRAAKAAARECAAHAVVLEAEENARLLPRCRADAAVGFRMGGDAVAGGRKR